jgi:hypothetical protein
MLTDLLEKILLKFEVTATELSRSKEHNDGHCCKKC